MEQDSPPPLELPVPVLNPLLLVSPWEYLVSQWRGEAITKLSMQRIKAN